MREAVHTIYVPPGWSVEQVWEHLQRGVEVVAPIKASAMTPNRDKGSWVNVDEKGKLLT